MEADNRPTRKQGLRPYGHHFGDGIVQVCFTLPVACSEKSQAAALAYAKKMGLQNGRVTWMESIGPKFTYFIIYGESEHSVDVSELSESDQDLPRVAQKTSDVDKSFRQILGRRIVVVVCTDRATDKEMAFEAMIGLKGISGDVGLEGYSTFVIRRERGFEDVDSIIAKVTDQKADALIVCEPTGGWGKGTSGLKDLGRKLKKTKELPAGLVTACWCFEDGVAQESIAGFDLCFGPGVLPSRMADSLVSEMSRRGVSQSKKSEGSSERPQKRRGLWGIFSRDS